MKIVLTVLAAVCFAVASVTDPMIGDVALVPLGLFFYALGRIVP